MMRGGHVVLTMYRTCVLHLKDVCFAFILMRTRGFMRGHQAAAQFGDPTVVDLPSFLLSRLPLPPTQQH